MTSWHPRSTLSVLLVLAAAAVFTLLGEESAAVHSVAVDEFAHLPSGLGHLDRGYYKLFRESPPLIEALVAIPAYLSNARRDYSRAGIGHRSEINVATDFFRVNGQQSFAFYRAARRITLLLSICCGLSIFFWAARYSGAFAAAICATLWFLDPNVMAHSSMATTDIGAAFFAVISTGLFWHEINRPSRFGTVITGLALGLALSSKFSLLALIPSWMTLLAVTRPRRAWWRFGVVLVVGLLVLNCVYRFEGTFARLGSFQFRSRLLSGVEGNLAYAPAGNRFVGSYLDRLRMPLPRDYVLGIDSLKQEEEIGLWTIRGGGLVRGGRWWSPFLTLFTKMPVGTILLLSAAAVHWWRAGSGIPPRLTAALAPAAILMAGLTSQTGMNWAYRHSVPAFAFFLIVLAGYVRELRRSRVGSTFLAVVLFSNIATLISIRPSYLSYANEIVGGPDRAQHWLLGSNYDWGLDLELLRRRQMSEDFHGPMALTYYGAIEPTTIGLPILGLPAVFVAGSDKRPTQTGEPKGTSGDPEAFDWCISSNVLNGMSCWFVLSDGMWTFGHLERSRLRPEDAYARAGQSIYIFRVQRSRTKPGEIRSLTEADLTGCIVSDLQDSRLGTP